MNNLDVFLYMKLKKVRSGEDKMHGKNVFSRLA